MEHAWSHGRCLNCGLELVPEVSIECRGAQSGMPTYKPEPQTQDARVFLVNGLSFGVNAPIGIDYERWLVSIMAAGHIALTDVMIPLHAIAAIVKGEALKSLQACLMLSTVKPPGGMN